MSIAIQSLEDIQNTFYINLSHRIDRKEHVEQELNKIGILNVNRFEAINNENGAIGCSMSHLKILQNAISNKLGHVLIIEDDITFLEPEVFKKQFRKFMELHGKQWDVVLFAGNNMPPYETIDNTCVKVTRCQTTTGYLVNGHYLRILADNIKRGLTHLIRNPTEHSIYAIDKYWFVLQGLGRWYLITPLTVIQREDYSDIENKITNYKNVMLDLDKEELFKAVNQMKRHQQYQSQIQNNIRNSETKNQSTGVSMKLFK